MTLKHKPQIFPIFTILLIALVIITYVPNGNGVSTAGVRGRFDRFGDKKLNKNYRDKNAEEYYQNPDVSVIY